MGKLINIGYGNVINSQAVVAIVSPDSAPIKRFIQSAREAGRIVDAAIQSIPTHYPSVSLEKYVVMPNHVHILLMISPAADGRLIAAPTIVPSRHCLSFTQIVTKYALGVL